MYKEKVVANISCDFNCPNKETIEAETSELIQHLLYQKGWGVKDRKHICPDCRKKDKAKRGIKV